MARMKFTEVTPTPTQQRTLDIAMVAFMTECPFFANIMHSIGKLVVTKDILTLGTDGRHVAINLDYFSTLTVPEQVFALAHEMWHLVGEHPRRIVHYMNQGKLRTKPMLPDFANVCADYTINADLIENGIGQCNPEWLYRPDVKGSELWEDVYERLYDDCVQPPPPQPKQGNGQGGSGGSQGKSGGGGNQQPQQGAGGQGPGQNPQPGSSTSKLKDDPRKRTYGKSDKYAQANDGRFDEVYDPPLNADGEEDLPGEHEFKEAIARAAAVAKAIGKLPANLQRLVDEILAPQVDWRDHIRMLVTGKIGARHETWTRPNRRRLALNPIVFMPGRKGYGCETAVVAVDTSGSIGEKELAVFFAEVGGILNDVKPRRIIVIGCDAAVSQVDEVTSLDEFEGLRAKGIRGGGGTRFEPVFEYVEEHSLNPETLVYLTDLYGSFPSKEPTYPVVWAATTDVAVPWGDVVRIKG